MLTFSQDFFKEEVRCGFTVSQKMKHAWAAEMEVLSQVIRVCKKYGLAYFADWGTLLGAVRHHGYVPWDDDIDISLKRKDYLKLFEVLPYELPDNYCVSSFYSQGEHNQPLSSVMNSRVILTEPEMIKQFHGCPYIVGIDISPLDFVPRDMELAKAQRELYMVVYDAAHRYTQLSQSGELEIYLPQIEELCRCQFDRTKPLRKQLWMLCERICSLYEEEESDDITWFPRTVTVDSNFRLKKEWYSGSVEMPFENMAIAVPTGYHEVLTTMYGDYSVMLKGISGHSYPFYAQQDALLEGIQKYTHER